MDISINAAVYAVMIAFIANIVLCPMMIPSLIKFKFGQYIRGDGPEGHQKKSGTPTMGGIMIIISFLLAAMVFMRDNPQALAVVGVTLGFGIVGFLDDFIKIIKKRNLGLRAYQKLLAQIAIAVGFVFYWRTLPGYSTAIMIPFFPELYFDVGFLFPAFAVLVFLSSTNGANLTDGLDGLAAGVTALIAVFFMFAAWILDSPVLPVTGAAVGSLLGFLLFNSHPARVFMGDTGSLALGGFVAAVALMLNMPLFLLIVAVIYVVESLSVIIQVGYFKLTRKRFFKMAPIHHAFELSGWPETKVVAFFYVVTAMACLLGYLALMGV
ncbi:MAG: phospho-N-acetylmuramoyl-pentapeptide-transferase [Defluviitaleaceae bacterium]|nr:phospho-N-acetylmuramoyl-pentapeptide-transferase [Defluviitaleaceae bacterium]MCL2264322.1 phospho-N-acetylmuramoyl-pentapeptide-transferase [Defluviitaleaceae bacterium]